MAKLKISGLEKLEHQLKQNCTLDDVKKVVRKNGLDLNKKIVRNATFTRGYSTGETKRSIVPTFEDGGFTAVSGAQTEYAPYVEHGTRFMDAQPFVAPAYQEQKEIFISDMKELVR